MKPTAQTPSSACGLKSWGSRTWWRSPRTPWWSMQLTKVRADRVIAELPEQAWARLSCGDGSHGQRIYDWARSTSAHCTRRSGDIGCWAGARSVTRPASPITCVSNLPTLRSASWYVLPARGGLLRSPSRRPRTRPVWTITRFVVIKPARGCLKSPELGISLCRGVVGRGGVSWPVEVGIPRICLMRSGRCWSRWSRG
jgi:hypothetical protein